MNLRSKEHKFCCQIDFILFDYIQIYFILYKKFFENLVSSVNYFNQFKTDSIVLLNILVTEEFKK